MSIFVAYQPTAVGRLAVLEAGYEAEIRNSSLVVVHVAEAVDVELLEQQTASLREEISDLLTEADLGEVSWALHVATGADAAGEILDLLGDDAELLVVGARRRRPVGKMIMGSVTQTLVLQAEIPILVVKTAARNPTKAGR